MDNDLISREALKNYARKVLWEENPTNISLLKMFDNIIDNAPTVEPIGQIITAYTTGFDTGVETVKRPQGDWELSSIQVIGENWYNCSICGRKIRTSTYHLKEYPFCHCGAEMEGGNK